MTSTPSEGPLRCPQKRGSELPQEPLLMLQREGFDARTLRGLTINAAAAQARRHGCTVRTVERDGEAVSVTPELRPQRINVAVADGKIVGVEYVG